MSNYFAVPTASGGSTPNQAGLAAGTANVDLRAEVSASTWTGSKQGLITQVAAANGAGSRFGFWINNDGTLGYKLYTATGVFTSATSGAPGLTLGRVWLRVLHSLLAGTVAFYWSHDGSSWTQIGSTITGLSTSGMDAGGSPPAMRIGTSNDLDYFVGTMYRTQVIIGGVTKINQDWTAASVGAGPWTGGTGESWTRLGTSTVIAEVARSASMTSAGTGTSTFASGKRSVVVDPAAPLEPSTTLGCGVTEVFIVPRGGSPADPMEAGFVKHSPVGRMLWTSLQYNLPLSDVGALELTLDGVSGVVGGAACCSMLSGVAPWIHEVCVVRDGVVTFNGPIVQMLFPPDKVVIRARDLTAWFDRRAVHDDLGPFNTGGTDVVDAGGIQSFVAQSALLPDPSPQIAGVKGKVGASLPTTGTFPIGYQINTTEYANAGAKMRDLARMGSDFRLRHSTRELLCGYQGAGFIHQSDGYGFPAATFRSTDGWVASGGSTIAVGAGILKWTIPGSGTFRLQTTLHDLKPGRPHACAIQALGTGFPPYIDSAVVVIDGVEQGPDYAVALQVSGNWQLMQCQTLPTSGDVDFSIYVVIEGAAEIDFITPQVTEFWPVMMLTDESFTSPPEVLLDGLVQVNRQIVLGAGASATSAGVVGEAPLPVWPWDTDTGLGFSPNLGPYPALTALQTRDGLLEGVVSESTITDPDTATRAAQSRYNVLSASPLAISDAPLSHEALFAAGYPNQVVGATAPTQADIRDLAPGNYVSVQLVQVCQPYSGYLRIQNVAFDCQGQTETVKLSLISPRDI